MRKSYQLILPLCQCQFIWQRIIAQVPLMRSMRRILLKQVRLQ